MCVYDCTGSIGLCMYPLSSVHVSTECVVYKQESAGLLSTEGLPWVQQYLVIAQEV